MANRAATVKQSDLTRYLKAASAAGVIVSKIEVARDGTVRIFTPDAGPDEGSNPCDRLLK
ncbi:hypothetical protein [Pontibaca methylaminivorans]|uniref:Uncharacterized protein n=1 Tax=Pontibaca methylaminivorans TaxID=515897 RepID=A0A1R3WYG7_9RHOB|nr:hypothetical protein [Pontibaca methylaminivorans]SIT83537.1 hypothetical protein SAMN05421849_1926 [Pontibaca methylaminivorans]